MTDRLLFIGDRNYKTVMHPNDVKAVAELSDLARVLSAIEEIKKVHYGTERQKDYNYNARKKAQSDEYIVFGKPTVFNGRINVAHPDIDPASFP